jgi:transposase
MQIPRSRRDIKKLKTIMRRGDVDVWAMDEVHFQQHGSRLRMWVPPEVKDPVLLHHPTRKSVGYFGAVRLNDGAFVYAREPEKFNALTTLEFFRMLLEKVMETGRKAVVILDNARYHHAKLHKVWRDDHAERITFEYLPPYSPDLNPSERVWKLTRRMCLHNRYMSRLEDVIENVEEQFVAWKEPNDGLRRLCAIY